MLRLGLILLILPALALMMLFFVDQATVTACLELGGSYNYQSGVCDSSAKHPFVPLISRYPLAINLSMLLCVVGLILCMKGLLWKKPSP